MSKKFILATDPLTADQENALRQKLGSTGFWHWLPNFWLIKSNDSEMTAARLRDAIAEVAPAARCFTTEVAPIPPWGARTKPDAQGNDMAEWLRQQWETP